MPEPTYEETSLPPWNAPAEEKTESDPFETEGEWVGEPPPEGALDFNEEDVGLPPQPREVAEEEATGETPGDGEAEDESPRPQDELSGKSQDEPGTQKNDLPEREPGPVEDFQPEDTKARGE